MKLSNNSNIYFTSDPHYFHSNAIKYCNRPFSNVDEMNETLIKNHNSKVKPNDNVFLLGDISFTKPHITEEVLKQLNGTLYLIKGNHDWNIKGLSKYFAWEKDFAEIEVPDETTHNGYQYITLCHYEFVSWNKKRYGSWMLHGHSHFSKEFQKNKFLKNPDNFTYDVGVDANDFYPISYYQIKSFFSSTFI